jgi:aspartate kinase
MIVMKFGGTSVQDEKAIARVIAIVRGRLDHRPVVVVSAMARVTDQLQTMGRAAAAGDLDSALSLARALRERHHATSARLLGRHYENLRPGLDDSFNQLETVLRGIAAIGELSPRTLDYIFSFGELLSSRIVAAAFAAHELQGEWVDSRQCIVTDAQHTHAVPQFEETNQKLAARLRPLLEAGKVPVMGGFIGATREGTTTTIGRGGSDFSAAIVGAALDADRIEIWTDVDGMKTTDPNLCPSARRLEEVSFDEAAEMAFFGAKVLHPATLIPAMEKNIPVYVLNSRNPRNKGTCVRNQTTASAARGFKAIAAKKNVSIISLTAGHMLEAHGFLHDVFQVFKQHHVPVDIVSTSEVSVSLTVDSKADLESLVADLRKVADVELERGKAILCVLHSLRGVPGTLAKVFSALGDINVRMVSQGASEINISFVIEEKDVPEAVRRLHKLIPTGRKRMKLPSNAAAAASRLAAGIAPLVYATEEES